MSQSQVVALRQSSHDGPKVAVEVVEVGHDAAYGELGKAAVDGGAKVRRVAECVRHGGVFSLPLVQVAHIVHNSGRRLWLLLLVVMLHVAAHVVSGHGEGVTRVVQGLAPEVAHGRVVCHAQEASEVSRVLAKKLLVLLHIGQQDASAQEPEGARVLVVARVLDGERVGDWSRAHVHFATLLCRVVRTEKTK